MVQRTEDEAGPSHAISQSGASWHPEDHPALHPQEDERGGIATRLTLVSPSHRHTTGVLAAMNAVMHPCLTEHMADVLIQIEQAHAGIARPPEAERPTSAPWDTWLGYPSHKPSLPP
jgi:hypothetical protein